MPHVLTALLVMFNQSAGITNHYTQTVESWRGSNVASLVERWGVPDKKIAALDGSKIFVYKTKSNSRRPGQTTGDVDVGVGQGNNPVISVRPNTNSAWSRSEQSFSCVAAFKADKSGKIIGTQTYGSGCSLGEHFANNTVYSNKRGQRS